MKRFGTIGLCLLLALALAGCGTSPVGAVQALMKALHGGDIAAANALFVQGPFSDVVPSTFGSCQAQAAQAVFAAASAEIVDTSVRGSSASVTLKITAANGKQAMQAAREELWAISEDIRSTLGEDVWLQLKKSDETVTSTAVLSALTDRKVQDRMLKLYQDAFQNADKVTAQVTAHLTKKEGEWLFTSQNDALLSALLGGGEQDVLETDLFFELLP